MALSVVEKDNRFRVEWQGNSTDWLAGGILEAIFPSFLLDFDSDRSKSADRSP